MKPKKITPAQKALKHHQLLASGEQKKNKAYTDKFGSFEDRFKKFAEWKKKL